MRIGLTRYKNRGFNCERFARIESRESRCESPMPLRFADSRGSPDSPRIVFRVSRTETFFANRASWGLRLANRRFEAILANRPARYEIGFFPASRSVNGEIVL